MFDKILIANRGAIACRIQRSLRTLGVKSVAVYSEADVGARHVREADEAWLLGGPRPAESYLNVSRLLEVALASGAQAIHPGYGFLSENAEFAQICESAGLRFIGPTPAQMRLFGLKHTARAAAAAEGLPLLSGTGLLPTVEAACSAASDIGYPVMLKSTAGGGGIGMRLVHDEAALREGFEAVSRLSRANFSEPGLYLEKYVSHARHIEVQLFGDGRGEVIALGERDCSVQRRNQKVIEETPAPGLSPATRDRLIEAAIRLGRSVNYRSAGTVEFILDATTEAFYFLEVNTRLQVEHGVTEAVTGVDLVAWMVQLAAGDLPPLGGFSIHPQGAAIQARVYAEDPNHQFRPSAGTLGVVAFPTDQLRVDGWIESGGEVPPYYDPMLAKLIAHGADREAARTQLRQALADTVIGGIETNLEYLHQVLGSATFVEARHSTRFLDEFAYAPRTIDVIEPGMHSTVQDWPGRLGYWDVGVPPSGPMDALAHRLANRLLGNASTAATLELTAIGPRLRFNTATHIAITGACMRATRNGQPLPHATCVQVAAGDELHLGPIEGPGLRTYLAVAGGFATPRYLGSRATFTLGQFGGHAGRVLRAGDVLPLGHDIETGAIDGTRWDQAAAPVCGPDWRVRVLYGPHGAPDFFTDNDIAMLVNTAWEVHHNSSRTGVRLIGPKPTWARTDGGEAGLHPSNIHDNAYAIGAVDFTGDMPVILGPDGPSLGGFVCPFTIISADLWKMGQLRPGDRLRFVPVSPAEAMQQRQAQELTLDSMHGTLADLSLSALYLPLASPVLFERVAGKDTPALRVRRSGDANLLLEFGPPVLDLALRFRVQALLEALRGARLPGVIDLTPGVRSLQIHFDLNSTSVEEILGLALAIESALPPVDDLRVASRIVHLPLSWDDPATQRAIDRYTQTVRADAPWCPSNIEFIRRINGLERIEDVYRVVFEASYLVLGLGDVYLGAPVATPLDPRHRLVTTKYNPARTWTPENAVGIGGAYLCVYGMEGPGGYQFVGRTVQMWNRYHRTRDFTQPWLLRFFDQIRFHPVPAEELLDLRARLPGGQYSLEIEETEFSFADYQRFLTENAPDIARFKANQQEAFHAERERWHLAGLDQPMPEEVLAAPESLAELPPGAHAVTSPVAGSVWKTEVAAGEKVVAGQTLLVLESMKMEVPLCAPCAGHVLDLQVREGSLVAAGQALVLIQEGES